MVDRAGQGHGHEHEHEHEEKSLKRKYCVASSHKKGEKRKEIFRFIRNFEY